MSAPLAGVRIAQVGRFDPEYARNRILVKALRRAGAEVTQHSFQEGLLRRAVRVRRALRSERADVTLVSFPGHADVLPARLARPRTPLIWDAMMSMYETSVVDRGTVRRRSIRSAKLRFDDSMSSRLASVVLLDTEHHARWFADRFGGPASKYRRLWVGADDEIMRPLPAPPALNRFTVVFYGTFIPLQGVEHIVAAAAIVSAARADVHFVLIGSGQTHAAAVAQAAALGVRNLEFRPRVPPAELAAAIGEASVCLGVFGSGLKTARVIANKVYDSLAVGRAVITADTPAVREIFTPGTDVVTCPAGDPAALAKAVLELAADSERCARIAAAGHALFQREFSIDAVSRSLAPIVLEVLR